MTDGQMKAVEGMSNDEAKAIWWAGQRYNLGSLEGIAAVDGYLNGYQTRDKECMEIIDRLERAMSEWHARAWELCEAESEKNEDRRRYLGLKHGQFEISGDFRLNQAWNAFAAYELYYKETLTHLKAWRESK